MLINNPGEMKFGLGHMSSNQAGNFNREPLKIQPAQTREIANDNVFKSYY